MLWCRMISVALTWRLAYGLTARIMMLIREGRFTRRHNARSARVNRVMSRRENPIHSRDVMSSRMTNLETGDESNSDVDSDSIFDAMC
jgi:hypothetical protein